MIRSFWPYITRERDNEERKKERKTGKNLVAPPEGWNLNHFLFRGEISLCSRRFCVSFEVLNRGEVARGLRRRIQVFLLKPLLRVPIELIDRYTLFLRGRPSSRSPPLSPPRLRRRKQPVVPSALSLTFSFFLSHYSWQEINYSYTPERMVYCLVGSYRHSPHCAAYICPLHPSPWIKIPR